jgi:hypothetical protein
VIVGTTGIGYLKANGLAFTVSRIKGSVLYAMPARTMMHAAALVYGSPACRNGGSGNRARLQRLSHQHERNPKPILRLLQTPSESERERIRAAMPEGYRSEKLAA